MKAYRERIDWLYSNDPAALKTYADFVAIQLDMAKRTRDDFFPKSAVDPDKDRRPRHDRPGCVTLKYTAAPVTKEQLAELIQNPAAPVAVANRHALV
jgi:NitT/TauT family transport system substrate-binding protein